MMAKDLSPFLDAVLALKAVRRAGWAAKAGIKDAESVADHTFSMCAMGMALSDIMGLDTERVVRMILLHDLAESVVGDYMPGQVAAEKKMRQENEAMKSILACLPPKVRSDYQKIWREFLARKSRAARFVHRLDRLEMALQARRYGSDGHDKKLLAQFLQSAQQTVGKEGDLLSDILRSIR
jgi:putative hydrolase of HD superfamily